MKRWSYRRNAMSLAPLATLLLLWALPRIGCPQQGNLTSVSVEHLPNAPGRASLESTAQAFVAPAPSAGISGTLMDPNGAALASASVTLIFTDGSADRAILSGSGGEFVFRGLPAGDYTLRINAAGMAPLVFSHIDLRADEERKMPRIVMAIAGTTTDVQVVVTKTELASEQISAAEHQRVLGILPNFYSSYIWDAEPLNPKQKFNLAVHSLTDPVEFVGTGIIAAAEQANNTFSGYGQGAEGYAKRYGAAYADDAIGKLIGSAILPSILHQDPRYFYKGSGSTRSRAFYAVTRALVTRGDNGQVQPNYSRLLGAFAAGGFANLYYPSSDRGLGLTLADGFVSIAGHAVDNLIREFLLRRLTPHVPGYERGKQ